MAKKSKRVIDPLFPLPTGAEDQFSVADVHRIVTQGATGVGLGDIQMVGPIGIEEPVYYLEPPESFVIFDQKLRRAPGGQQVVDIVIAVEDVVGATEYEVQIAKVIDDNA